jgi:predicted RNase H-like HicB family nuclease
MTTFQVIVEPEDGAFMTYVPALDFASTDGPTRDVALDRTREMIAGYLEAAEQDGSATAHPRIGAMVRATRRIPRASSQPFG